MADTIKSASELNLDFSFYDGDTRLVKMQNPKSDLTAAQIKAAADVVVTNAALIGDKAGAAVVGLIGAKAVSKTVTKLDLANA